MLALFRIIRLLYEVSLLHALTQQLDICLHFVWCALRDSRSWSRCGTARPRDCRTWRDALSRSWSSCCLRDRCGFWSRLWRLRWRRLNCRSGRLLKCWSGRLLSCWSGRLLNSWRGWLLHCRSRPLLNFRSGRLLGHCGLLREAWRLCCRLLDWPRVARSRSSECSRRLGWPRRALGNGSRHRWLVSSFWRASGSNGRCRGQSPRNVVWWWNTA